YYFFCKWLHGLTPLKEVYHHTIFEAKRKKFMNEVLTRVCIVREIKHSYVLSLLFHNVKCRKKGVYSLLEHALLLNISVLKSIYLCPFIGKVFCIFIKNFY